MGLYHLLDVGFRHLDDETVEETIAEINSEDDSGSFMSNETKIRIIRIAQKLAAFETSFLLVYVQRNMQFDVMDGISVQNLIEGFEKYVEMMTWDSCPSDIYADLSEQVELSDEEIKYIHFGYTIPEGKDDD